MSLLHQHRVRPIVIREKEPKDQPLSILFNIDISGSVTEEGRRKIEQCVSGFQRHVVTRGLGRTVETAVQVFGTETKLLQDWTPSWKAPALALPPQDDYELTDLYGSCLAGAERLAERKALRDHGEPSQKREKDLFLITITDGFESRPSDVETTAELIERLSRKGLAHYFLGVGDECDWAAAERLTVGPGCAYFRCEDTDSLEAIFPQIEKGVMHKLTRMLQAQTQMRATGGDLPARLSLREQSERFTRSRSRQRLRAKRTPAHR